MFRELVRKNKKLSMQDCERILRQEKRGVLSVIGDNDYPYGMPMNHFYNEENGKIYFHCGKKGHRLDALKKHNQVSFCVYDEGTCAPGQWALKINSVIVFGKICIIDDIDTIADITTKLSRKFTQDEDYIQNEIATYAKGTLLLELTPEHICGKWVEEA